MEEARSVRVAISYAPVAQVAVDALAVPITGGEALQDAALELDGQLDGLLREVLESGEHRGRINEVLTLATGGRIAARRVLLYGLGSAADLDGQRLRWAHHEMVRAARSFGYRRLAVVRAHPLRPEDLAAVVEGCILGTFERRSHQTGPQPAGLEELHLSGFGTDEEAALAARQTAEATNRVRQWQNTPPNELNPEGMARIARDLAGRHGLEVEVLGPEELVAGGYNLIAAVGAAAAAPPRLIRLHHRGAPGSDTCLALVGKGITFDAGGLALKPPEGQRTMKMDMSGGAAVLGAMEVIAARRVPMNVMGVVAAAENMISGEATRTGDVVTSASGKTVEIVNTDAEGRLVLADALTFAIRRGATHLVDLATLTGTARQAIGHAATLAVANDDAFWARLARASELAGERVWRLPMYPDYRVLLASRIADLKNAYYGEAGAITAGMFIAQFVESRPWVHLDIAASTWNGNTELVTLPRGPLGAGTRLCIKLAELMAEAHRLA
jgi:leucyl aminopeptidase